MADYRCSVKPRLNRGKGASVARAVAYIAREKVEDERTGERYDYSGNKDKALWSGIYAPKGAPEWAHNLQKLTNEIECAEKRKDAQLALPIELSLAHELTLEQNRWMMQDFIKENFTRQGYATIAAIHEPPHGGDPRNIHAHLLVTLRTIDEKGFAATKKEQQENYMSRSERVEVLRQSWEKHLKHHLERHGFEKEASEVSCKSLKDRGIDREAQEHLGPTASQMERRGEQTERGDINREIEANNRKREQLKAAEKELSQAIAEAQQKLDTEAKQRAEAERRAQIMRARDTAAAQAIQGAWMSAPRDAMAFMTNLNERGLYVARNQKGYYFAVEKSGYAHYLPEKDMHEAIDALRCAHGSLVIPTIEEQRDQLAEERDREAQRRSMHLGATLYNHASMPLMQRDALLHIQDAHRQQEANRQRQERQRAEAERQRQKAERQRQAQERQKRETEEQQRQREERERLTAQEQPRDQAQEDKRSRTEQTEYQQRRSEREKLREQLGLRQQGGRERGDDGGRERERE